MDLKNVTIPNDSRVNKKELSRVLGQLPVIFKGQKLELYATTGPTNLIHITTEKGYIETIGINGVEITVSHATFSYDGQKYQVSPRP
jgi:hypothetical protein